MEYVITVDRPFEEIEALTTAALEQQGLVVQRTFSLRSALVAERGNTGTLRGSGSGPGYSVLMLYATGTPRRPLGLLTLYERGRQIVINPILTPLDNGQPASPVEKGKAASGDADAELVATLVLSGLEFCVKVARGEECIDTRASGGKGTASGRLIQDPVCGKWIDLRQAEAGIEHEGTIYHLCCSLCQEEFEREPARYARTG